MAQVWDPRDGQRVAVLTGHTSTVVQGAFSPGNDLIATASYDSTIRIWEASTGGAVLTLPVGGSRLTGVSFSPNGGRVLTANEDGAASVFSCDVCGTLTQLRRLAERRVTRGFTVAECQEYFNRSRC